MKLRARSLAALAMALCCFRAAAQPVISNYSGLLLFTEGSVSLNGEPVSHNRGRFLQLRNGASLSTAEGRAEILLAPGVLLWLGDNSSLRMQDDTLANARVELLTGSAVMQTTELGPGNAVTLTHNGAQIRAMPGGRYRTDASADLDRWAKRRAQMIAARNFTALRKNRHLHGVHPAYPGPLAPIAGRT